MKHNAFEGSAYKGAEGNELVLSHSDEQAIIAKAKENGSFKKSFKDYMQNTLQHDDSDPAAPTYGIDGINLLFPDYKMMDTDPQFVQRDTTWCGVLMGAVRKVPFSRIKSMFANITEDAARARGYIKGTQKLTEVFPLLSRTTDPQTVYRRDALHRDDIIDITDFDVVEYQYGIMKQNLNEEIATAIMIGDGRSDGDDNKISEEHIRSIWHDDDLYTIKVDVDIDAAKQELQGSSTVQRFGENYIYAEAIINSSLYAREHYKGSGKPDFYCTPHLLNVMLLARDLNGRRIYSDVSDLAKALNVNAIYTAEQFEGKTRTTTDNKTKKLLGIFVNLADYQVGSTKGGEITRFNQFDIDFNQEKYLIETRISGALTKIYSAIALEEPVTPPSDDDDEDENDGE